MDTRLLELLPKGTEKRKSIVKDPGAVVSHPFGSIMCNILVAIYELKEDEVCVVCGWTS